MAENEARSNAPRVVILAGPNGAGKSTVAADVLRDALSVQEFVNADRIATGLADFSPETVALEAARIALERLRELAAQRADFAFETTLASRSLAPWLRSLIADGYEFHLVFLWLPSPDAAIARVARRVSDGGHNVPEETVRRRYWAGLRNFFQLYQPLAETWQIVDNSARGVRLIAAGSAREASVIHVPQSWNHIRRSVEDEKP